MGAPTTWLLRLFALFGLFSLSFAYPLTAISTTDDISIRNLDQASNDTLNTRDDGFHLDKRAIAKFNMEEQKALRILAIKIDRYLEDGDVVFFVGNSGSYLINAFDTTKYHMKAIPNSKAKYYGTPGYIPTFAGLERYWRMIVGPPLLEKQVERIILVDHSGSGQSVDGFRNILLDACEIGMQKRLEPEEARRAKMHLSKFPMYLINVIDATRTGKGKPVVDPKTVPVLAKLTTGGSNLVNEMVGGNKHPRVQPEYPPMRWETPAKDCASPKDNAAAKAMKDDIVYWNQRNGGLIGSLATTSSSLTAASLPKKKTKKPKNGLVKTLMLYTLT